MVVSLLGLGNRHLILPGLIAGQELLDYPATIV